MNYGGVLPDELMLTKKKKKANPKFKISHFFEELLVETLLRSIHEFWGSESVVYFQSRCRLKMFFHILPCEREIKKKENIKKNHFLKQ